MHARTETAPSLRISEIFLSLQGEAATSGLPTVFVRLTGCPLRCSWCDTAYAFQGGESQSLDAILKTVADSGVTAVCVTGGEPLAQKNCLPLLAALCDAGYEVSLETSGALDVSAVDVRVSRVVDVKCPGSGEAEKNRWDNLKLLTSRDQLKFVLADRADYDWAVAQLQGYGLLRQARAERPEIWFSPVAGQLDPTTLADWIVADRLPVRLQLQLHKLLWQDAQGR
jgi:7-carboxy-7-deazaguanine synthase